MARDTTPVTPGSGLTLQLRRDASGAGLETVALGIDGSDSVVPADATTGLAVRITNDNIGAAGDSPPALATNAAGVTGWLRKVVDTLNTDLATLPSATSGAPASVSSSATVVTLKASNSSRKGFLIYNNSVEVLYVKFGTGASNTSFNFILPAGGLYEMSPPIFTGIVTGVWANVDGNAQVTELT